MPRGLSPSEIDRMVAQTRDALDVAMEARYGAGDSERRHAAGNAVWRAQCVLKALDTLDAAFPRSDNHVAHIAHVAPNHEKDTSDTNDANDKRELLSLMEQAQAVAERIDKVRGHVVDADSPLQPGESRGTDYMETLSEIALRLRGEIFGGNGRD